MPRSMPQSENGESKARLHFAELHLAAGKGACVEMATIVERDHHRRQMRRRLVPVDHRREHVLLPMPLTQPVKPAGEVAVLFGLRHRCERLGGGGHQVLQRMDGILADGLRCPFCPGRSHALRTVRSDPDLVGTFSARDRRSRSRAAGRCVSPSSPDCPAS